MFSRGVQLAAYGSIEDRVMREMVLRERQERVAHLDAVAKMIARVFNVDVDKAFSSIVSEYASEVFQETYDPDLLRRRVAIRRVAAARVRSKREHEERMLEKLDKMGDYADQVWEKQRTQKKSK
jgi:hypothetical protein